VAQAPLDPHVASASELQERLESERSGVAFLVYRDGSDRQRIVPLEEGSGPLTVGRGSDADVSLPWDDEASRIHACLERVGRRWTVVDDGLSRNGTFVNGERLGGRRRLHDRDQLRMGRTIVAFRAPDAGDSVETSVPDDLRPVELSDMQRRVLLALCRPYAAGSPFATPATNQQIAEELHLSVDGVKSHLRALFAKFAIQRMPQGRKRARLVELAFQSGLVTEHDLAGLV
jgi:pSer/pThr/pTyr-binding forkhead associated (FHA) protein